MHGTVTNLADGRELTYYHVEAGTGRDTADSRPLEPAPGHSEARLDPVAGDWVTIAAQRQGRTHHPPDHDTSFADLPEERARLVLDAWSDRTAALSALPDAAEGVDTRRLVVNGERGSAFVPFAARRPYEVHLHPKRRVTDLTCLDAHERAELPTF